MSPDRTKVTQGSGRRPVEVPASLDRAAAIAWRILVVAAAIAVTGLVFVELRVVVVPLLVAMFIAAALGPPAARLADRGWPPLAATWAVIVASAILLVALGWVVLPRLIADLGEIGTALAEAYDDIKEWLVEGPVGLAPDTIDNFEDQIFSNLQGGGVTGLFDRAASAIEIITGIVLTLIVAFFYIKDGRRFAGSLLDALPSDRRPRTRIAMDKGWEVLQRYLVGVVVVGVVDAAAIGIGLAIIGVPLVLPLMAITFFAAFFPIVGAIVAGLIATLIALASGGLSDALLVVGLTTLVQQLDSDLVAPLVYSRAIRLHPLVVILALASGAVLAGIIGALLAVPIVAIAHGVRTAWRETDGATPAAEAS